MATTLSAGSVEAVAWARKARGAFFTPDALARFVADWAIRTGADRILEPSCGDAAFLVPAAQRLRWLAGLADTPSAGVVDAVEIDPQSAAQAQRCLQSSGVGGRVHTADFFAVVPTGSYSAVIGNPPYVRYQDFRGTARSRSRAAAAAGGVTLSGLASSWAAFVVHAAGFLLPGGRLGLVLPGELLSVGYAAVIRRFLLQRFARVDLVVFTERVFPDVQEEVVLVLAEGWGQGPSDSVGVRSATNVASLAGHLPTRTWRTDDPAAKWTSALLERGPMVAFDQLLSSSEITTLRHWGETTLGIVTGNNRFFALSDQRVRAAGLEPSDLLRLSPPGSRHLRGLEFCGIALAELARAGAATWLFRPPGHLSGAAAAYIASGEAREIPQAYKCRVRSPWWRVPLVAPADLLLTYMNADAPRLVDNAVGVHHLNSVHGVYLKPGLPLAARGLLPLAALNSLTLVGAETLGRAYGGGLLKIEPREAGRLPVPTPELLMAVQVQLSAVRGPVRHALEAGRLESAVALVDDVLLRGQLGLARSQLADLRDAHVLLRARRSARGRSVKANSAAADALAAQVLRDRPAESGT